MCRIRTHSNIRSRIPTRIRIRARDRSRIHIRRMFSRIIKFRCVRRRMSMCVSMIMRMSMFLSTVVIMILHMRMGLILSTGPIMSVARLMCMRLILIRIPSPRMGLTMPNHIRCLNRGIRGCLIIRVIVRHRFIMIIRVISRDCRHIRIITTFDVGRCLMIMCVVMRWCWPRVWYVCLSM